MTPFLILCREQSNRIFDTTLDLPPFKNGKKDIASAICKSNAFTIAGGGDTISALEKFANISSINYVSTGGGAFLQFLEGKELPGIEIIKKL